MAANRSFGKRRSASANSGKKCKPLASAPSWLVVCAIVLLALLAIVLVYRWYVTIAAPAVVAGTAGVAGVPGRDTFFSQPPAQLVFLYMDGCGWCEKFKPHWDAFVSEYGASLSAAGVTTGSYERKDPKAAAFGQVDGYPTVLLAVQGKPPIKFQGDRTPDGLIAFVRDNGYQIAEGFVEPQTMLGGMHKVVSSTKASQDGKTAGQQKKIQSGAGAKLGKGP